MRPTQAPPVDRPVPTPAVRPPVTRLSVLPAASCRPCSSVTSSGRISEFGMAGELRRSGGRPGVGRQSRSGVATGPVCWVRKHTTRMAAIMIRLGTTTGTRSTRRPRNGPAPLMSVLMPTAKTKPRVLNAAWSAMEISIPRAQDDQTGRDREHEVPDVEPLVGRDVDGREEGAVTATPRTSEVRGPRPQLPATRKTSSRNPYSSAVAGNGTRRSVATSIHSRSPWRHSADARGCE